MSIAGKPRFVEREDSMSTLFSFKAGSRVRIHHFDERSPYAKRFSSLGLLPGAQVTICRNDGRFPIIVSVRGARFMLGRSLCAAIYAESASSEESDS